MLVKRATYINMGYTKHHAINDVFASAIPYHYAFCWELLHIMENEFSYTPDNNVEF